MHLKTCAPLEGFNITLISLQTIYIKILFTIIYNNQFR